MIEHLINVCSLFPSLRNNILNLLVMNIVKNQSSIFRIQIFFF